MTTTYEQNHSLSKASSVKDISLTGRAEETANWVVKEYSESLATTIGMASGALAGTALTSCLYAVPIMLGICLEAGSIALPQVAVTSTVIILSGLAAKESFNSPDYAMKANCLSSSKKFYLDAKTVLEAPIVVGAELGREIGAQVDNALFYSMGYAYGFGKAAANDYIYEPLLGFLGYSD